MWWEASSALRRDQSRRQAATIEGLPRLVLREVWVFPAAFEEVIPQQTSTPSLLSSSATVVEVSAAASALALQ